MHFVLLFTNWLPDNVIFIRLRGKLARPFFKNCGKRLGIGRNVVFYNPSKIEIGNDVYIAYGCWLGGTILIEDQVLFGPYCVLASTNHQRVKGSYRFANNTTGEIIVKFGSWLGAHSMIIGENSILGSGSLLAANSVLNSIADPNCLYAGSPAVKIKEL
jgi:acetyltransferase-like isoleucine patch superfamily enzyme